MATIKRFAIVQGGANPGGYDGAFATLNAAILSTAGVNLTVLDEQWHFELLNDFNVWNPLTGRQDWPTDFVGNFANGQYVKIMPAPGYEGVYPAIGAGFGNIGALGRIESGNVIVFSNIYMYAPGDPLFSGLGDVYAERVYGLSRYVAQMSSLRTYNCVFVVNYTSSNSIKYGVHNNMTLYHTAVYSQVVRQAELHNCIVRSEPGSTCFLGPSCTGTNNASSDSSSDDNPGMTGSINNITDSEFQNVLSDPKDLHLAPSSQLISAGLNNTPIDFSLDIDSEQLPPTGLWSIGADYVGAVPIAAKPNALFFGQDF